MEYQDKLMPGSEKLTMINDCPTRWSSTFHMLKRVYDLRTAIMPTIADFDKLQVNLDFQLIKKSVYST